MPRFSETLMDHYEAPLNRRRMENADTIGMASLDQRPPFVLVFLKAEGELIREATFEAAGCGVTIACGSMLTELVRGKTLKACQALGAQQLSDALEGLPPDKQYCAEVAVTALQDALAKLSQSRPQEPPPSGP